MTRLGAASHLQRQALGNRPVPPGGMRLTIPPGYHGRWLSDPADRAAIEQWTAVSRERCLYNTPAYIDFARAQNGHADLLWLVREGSPVLGLPLHPAGDARITTGYSGAMFADIPGEAAMRRGVVALVALLNANKRLGFQVLQAAQAPAYDDPARVTTLAYLLDEHGHSGPPLYSRVLELEPLAGGDVANPDVSSELLLEHNLSTYASKLRNQVRRAVGRGLRVTCLLPSTDAELQAAYREFVPLHHESWRRTGMTPHQAEYWMALVRAILDGSGCDMVIYVRDVDGQALAAVTCHLREDRALYWAGVSSERGLHCQANPLGLHAAIQASRQLGVRHFELGRFHARESSQKELAITRYKSQFGGDLVPIGGLRTRAPLFAIALRRSLRAPFEVGTRLRSRLEEICEHG
jgi:hypothetical protein